MAFSKALADAGFDAHLGRDHRQGAPRQDRRRHDGDPDRPGDRRPTSRASTRREFQKLAEAAKADCPISRLLSPGAEITLNATPAPELRPTRRHDPAGPGVSVRRIGPASGRRARASGTMGEVPVEMSRERFEELVGDALDEVPAGAARPDEQRGDPGRGRPAAGRARPARPLRGHALTERGWDYAGVLPDRIFIYRHPILRICDNEEDVVDEVAVTVVHEIAHHFGIDDARLHELGWG